MTEAENPFSDYLKHPLLSKEEELILAQLKDFRREVDLSIFPLLPPAVQKLTAELLLSSVYARQEMIESNLRLVIFFINKRRDQGLPYQDLVQEGIIGLIKAVELYDWRKGCTFSSYATWWIRQVLSRAKDNTGNTIRIPVHAQIRRRSLRKKQDLLEQGGGEDSLTKAEQLFLDKLPCTVSADAPLSAGFSLMDAFVDPQPQPEDQADKCLLSQTLQEALKILTPREREVLTLRFGFNDKKPQTLAEIGQELGITRERVRQIECSALLKLRDPNNKHNTRLRRLLELDTLQI